MYPLVFLIWDFKFCLLICIRGLRFDFWSLDEVVGALRIHVRSSVTRSLGNLSLLFSATSQLVRACKCEKNVPSAFLIIFTVLAILVAIWLDVCNSLFKGWKSLKNLNIGVFETDFKQVQFVFRQTTRTYSESWGPVENFFDPPTPASGGRGG